MRRLILFSIFGLVVAVLPAWGVELLVVQGAPDAVSSTVMQGVRSVCPVESRVEALVRYSEELDLPRLVKEESPTLILAIGDPALATARKIPRIPVVSVASVSLDSGTGLPLNVTGVGMRVAPERYLAVCKAMGLKRVGVVYDPRRSGAYVEEARRAARQAEIELVLRTVFSAVEAVKELKSFAGKVDGLWLIPDSAILPPLVQEAYLTFSLELRKPVISYTREHLRKGAAVSLDIDWKETGRQAGELICRLLNGAAPQHPPQPPRSVTLQRNDKILMNLGFTSSVLDRLTP